jgi:hypothetical protein
MARETFHGKRGEGARGHSVVGGGVFDRRIEFTADALNRDLSNTFMNARPDDLFNLHSTILCALTALAQASAVN